MLAKYIRNAQSMTATDLRTLSNRAVNIAKDRSTENFAEKWGVCHFLCVAEDVTSDHQSRWLQYQVPLLQSLLAPVLPENSFNQIVFLALQRHLAATGHPAACTTVGKNGELVDFGVTLDTSGPFSMNCPMIGDYFRDMNTRRNHLPVSHPYEKKTAAQAQHLKAQEGNQFVGKLRKAYADLVTLMP